MRVINHALRAAGFVVALLSVTTAGAITIVSNGGYDIPESISLAPVGFANFGGSYFIPDAATNNIWIMPATGGIPSLFATPVSTAGNNRVDGGVFLPAGWGGDSANPIRFLVTAQNMVAYDSNGSQSLFGSAGGALTTPLIAPSGFPTYGGDLFVSDQNDVIWRAPHGGGDMSQFNSQVGIRDDGTFFTPFGLEFTPADFGPHSNSLLVSDALNSTGVDGRRYSQILALSENGTATPFAMIPLKDSPTGVESQTGLRQMAMAPEDYFLAALGIPGELLLVSVSGSRFGRGVVGDILALDLDGAIVASLRDDLGLTKFDPRGMLFTADGNLLISDTSPDDPIWTATARDFQRAPAFAPAPAPATMALMALGLLALVKVRLWQRAMCRYPTRTRASG